MEAKLIMTAKEMENRDNWLKYRGTGIGGSDAAVLMGLSQWKSPAKLWLEKTGRLAPLDISDSEVVYWGTVLEDVVAKEFAKRTGKQVKRTGMFRSLRYPWMLASIDRMIVGERAGLECKTTIEFNRSAWNGDEYCGIPPAYYCQVQWYMAVLGYPKWYIACLIGGHSFVMKEIPRDDSFIGKMITKSREFWDCWQNDTIPDPDSSEDYEMIIRIEQGYDAGGTIHLNYDMLQHIYAIDDLKNRAEEVENQVNYHKNMIKQAMGANRVGLLPGYKITWTDTSRVSKTGQPVRTFKITKTD